MIELINVTKEYKQKGLKPVKAANSISLTFGDSGMVFILGKSGSGKTTLLNLIGGLDYYNDGEIIINGKSTKSFSNSEWDAYRNTFVGFVFQDYNLIEEYTVSKNISLAIEFQGQTPTEKAINEILKQVYLENYGDRYPSELSTGQKQRVTIARAVIKNSQLILADEPTGSLDLKTGHTVLQLLKQISQEKLVIVVTHDREFAEMYGDRIIEIKDGQVIKDHDLHTQQAGTQHDISLKRSQFSLRNAIQLAASSMTLKPLKLIYTMFLSTITLLFFGVIMSATNYDYYRIIIDSMYTSGNNVLTLNRETNPNDLKLLSERFPNYSFHPVYKTPYNNFNQHFIEFDDNDVYNAMVTGSMEINETVLRDYSFKLLTGRLPSKNLEDNEIAISEYLYKHFERYGYYHKQEYTIEKPEDMVGKEIFLGDISYRIVGIIDTKFDFKRYHQLLDGSNEDFKQRVLYQEFNTLMDYGIHSVIFMREGYFQDYQNDSVNVDFNGNSYRFDFLDEYKPINFASLSNNYQLYILDENLENDERQPYKMVTTALKKDYNQDLELIKICREEFKYPINNQITVTLDSFQNFLKIGSKIVFYIALVMLVIHGVLLVNFILTSIMIRKKDIGILRAIGASQRDVFFIFIMESLILSLISALIGAILLKILVSYLNHYIMNQLGFLFAILHVEASQIFILVVLNILITILTTFVPIYKFSRRKPIEVIRSIY